MNKKGIKFFFRDEKNNLKNRKNQDKIFFRLQKLTRFLALFLKKEEKGTENRDF